MSCGLKLGFDTEIHFYFYMAVYVKLSPSKNHKWIQIIHTRTLRFPNGERRTGMKLVSKRIQQKGRTRGEAKGQVGREEERKDEGSGGEDG